MRKSVLFVLLMLVVFSSTPLHAQQIDAKKIYVGIGGSFVSEDFKGGGFDDTWGGNFKIGYSLHPLADIEFDFDYLDKFDEVKGFPLEGVSVFGEGELSVRTYMVALKGYFPISSEMVKLSVVVGGGIMTADSDFHANANGLSRSDAIDETDFCAKGGLGIDIFASKEISFGLEGNYTLGFSDVEDIRYFQFILGAAYHF